METIYFTLFAPATGGNHIRNLISLGCNDSEDYQNSILNSYKNTSTRNFHLTDLFFNGDLEKANSLEKLKLSNLPISICGHFSALLYISSNLDSLANLKIVVCDIPADNTPAWLRMRVAHHGFHDPYVMSEQRMLYSAKNVQQLFKLEKDNIIDLSTDLFHHREIRPVVDYLNSKLNLNLPVDLCQEIHTLWFNKNYNFV